MLVLAAILSNRMLRINSVHVIFTGFIGVYKHAIFREAYIKKYRRSTGGPEDKIKELSDVLVKRRIAFLDQAIITVEIKLLAFQILDNVANISTQLQDLSNQVADASR
jgi:hypothetical protein